MRQIGAIIIGIAISIVLSYFGVALLLDPIIKKSGESPESLMWYSYFIIYPAAILLGSVVTGCFLSPKFERGLLKNIKYVPGLYMSIPYVIGVFSAPALAAFLLLGISLNVVLSSIGLAIGIKVSSKRPIEET